MLGEREEGVGCAGGVSTAGYITVCLLYTKEVNRYCACVYFELRFVISP